MLLATKCPYCKTTFKVANDQLKLQSGLVRCGICHQVFNGIEHLTQADTAATSIRIDPAAAIPVAPGDARVEPVLDRADLVDSFFPDPAELAAVAPEAIETDPVPFHAMRDALLELPSHENSDVAGVDDALPEAVDAGADDDMAHLLFIRQARSRKRLKWLLAIATVLLGFALAGQAAYQFRDYLAAAYPQSRPTLALLCRMTHCQLRLPAQLDAISYEADELHSLAHENTFEFSLLMRNHSALPQAWPHLELTLKDPKKQVVLRRVFAPSDYVSSPRDELGGFQAGQEQAVKLYFVVDKVKATDYVVSIFYP